MQADAQRLRRAQKDNIGGGEPISQGRTNKRAPIAVSWICLTALVKGRQC